ncbi:prolipoprotein diacylglyceryl transferase [Chloroflexota bacterium]
MIEININPVVFWNVRWYGILIASGIGLLILWVSWQIKKCARISYDTFFTAALVGIPSGVVVARLLHVIDNIIVAKLHPELALAGRVIDYTQYPERILGGAGLSIYGAILGATLGIWIYSRFSELDFGYFTDLLAPGVIIAQVMGRLGCLVNGCCPGAQTSVPWAIIYTHPGSLGPPSVPTHPSPVYEIIYLLISLGIVLWLRGRLKPDGSLFLVYLGLYALWRLGSDFLRVGTPFLFSLHQAQVIAIIVLVITVPLLIKKTRWVKTKEANKKEEY